MKTLLLYSLLLASVLLTGCNHTPLAPDEELGSQEFRFDSYLKEGDEVHQFQPRALQENLSNGYQLIGITSNQVTLGTGVANPSFIFKDEHVNANGTLQAGGKRFWGVDGTINHTFFAYTALGNVGARQGVNSTTSTPSIGFKQPDDPNAQIDLLTADPVMNIKAKYNPPVISLFFRHRLSRIIINLMGSGGARLVQCTAQVRYGANTIKNEATSIDLIPDGGSIRLKDNAYHSSTLYTLLSDFTLPTSATSAGTAIPLGDLIFLPQTLGGESIEVIIKYKKSPNDPQFVTTAVLLPSAPLLMEPEKQYTFLLNIIERTANLTISDVLLDKWSATSTVVDELK